MKLSPHQNIELADEAWNNGLDLLAQHHYQQAVNMLRSQPSNDAETIAHGLAMLALFKKDEGDYEKALEFYSEGISHLEKILGPSHKTTIFFLGLKTSCLHQKGDLNVAEQFARIAVTRAELALGPRHRYLGDALMALALILWDQKNKVEAEIYLRRAIHHDMELQGKRSGIYAAGLMTLADWLETEGRIQEAHAVIMSIEEIVRVSGVFTEMGEAAFVKRFSSITEKIKLLQ
jgi:tetratricopeptide (TPR) repeat protein